MHHREKCPGWILDPGLLEILEDYGSGAHRPLLCPLRPLFRTGDKSPAGEYVGGESTVTVRHGMCPST
eukprot:scaffold8470_cov118-Skeletonema_menzelii.AAC.1